MATHIQPEGLSDKGIAGETAAPPVRKGERKFSSGIEIVLLAAFMIVMLFPVVWMLETALKTTADIYAVPAKVFSFSPTFEHFQNVFSFIRQLEEMQRLARVKQMTVKCKDGKAGQVDVSLTMNIYFSEL